jgi:serum/glucocorticoid-regulated kinase 2
MNDFINKKYTIINELTSGEFGKIYKAQHKMSQQIVVIKIEEKSDSSLLLYETKMYNHLKNFKYISKLRNFYNNDNKYILIIDYHGESIYNLKNSLNYFNLTEKKYFINNLILNIVDAMECLHDLDFIYRDVKPQNFCFNKVLKVIDLGNNLK